MKVHQLFENDLNDVVSVMLLMKHGGLPRVRASDLCQQLKSFKLLVGGRYVPANLRWVEDALTGTLRFISADIPGSWRSGPAAVGRGRLLNLLVDYGFSVARFQVQAAERLASRDNGPHIFFWGPGTPPMDPTKMEKIWGTKEADALKRLAAHSK